MISLRKLVGTFVVGTARYVTHGSGNIESAYNIVAAFGFLWGMTMKSVKILGIDEVIYAPAKSKLVPIPLLMTTTEIAVKEDFKPKLGDVVVDVGSYIGRYALIASKLVGDSGRVIGIEPNPENFAILDYNIRKSHSTNMEAFCVAASNHEGVMKLYLGESGGWTSIFRSGSGGWKAEFHLSDRFIEVPCVPLDNFLKEHEVEIVDWMKIDVEGAEAEVLEGITNILQKSEKLNLIIELHPLTNQEKVSTILNSCGYRIQNLSSPSSFYHILASK
jgi:FkbM family methyltransferase